MNVSVLLQLVIYLLIVGGVFWLLWWLIGYVNPPEPINKVLRIIIAVIAVLFLANLLLGMIGAPIVRLR